MLLLHTLPQKTCKQSIYYLAEGAVQWFVLSHELIQEHFKRVDPHFDRRLPPVPLLLTHGLLQDVLKQSVQVFVADTLPIIHLRRKTAGSQEESTWQDSDLD